MIRACHWSASALAALCLSLATVTPALSVDEGLFEGYPGFDRLHEAVRQSLSAGLGEQNNLDLESSVGDSTWVLSRLWQLGPASHGFMTSGNLLESDVDSDAAGNVYILSQEAMKVFVVSESGELIDSIGRAGQGPGEFANPGLLDVSGGVLHVFDRTGRVERWRLPSMELLPRLALREHLNVSGRFRGTVNGFLASEAVWNGSQDGGDRWERYLVDWNQGEYRRIADGPVSVYTPFEAPACIAGVVMPRILQPVLVWDSHGDLMVIASYSDYAADVLRDGEPVGRIARNTVPRLVTRAMLQREVEDLEWGPPGNPCIIPADQVIEARGHADTLAPVADVLISPSEEIWVVQVR